MKTAANLNIVSCSRCAALWKAVKPGDRCECGAKLHVRKPDSLRRTWALVIAACILYFPANILPVTVTTSFPEGEQQDTIMSGIIYFWVSGSWVVASIIFIASFVVPLFKLGVMILLLITVQRRSNWQLLLRTKLYRAVEVIGRWSMLDVFVVSLLTGLVQIDGFATVYPGPGIAAFAVVVILTMLASMSFDPRLLWDAAERDPEVLV